MEFMSPEIQEVQLLLDEWNLPSLKETFAREEITIRALECLHEDDKDINEIIPKFGIRKIFWSCLKKWKEERYGKPQLQNELISNIPMQRNSTPINSSISLLQHSTPIIPRFPVIQSPTNFEDNQPSTSGIIEQSSFKTPQFVNKSLESEEPTVHASPVAVNDFEFLNLKKILEFDKMKTQQIKEHYKTFNELNTKHQDMLTDVIIRAIYDKIKDVPNRKEIFRFLAHQIEERFPGEDRLTYIGVGNNHGKLINKYYTTRLKEQQGKLNSPNISGSKSEQYEQPSTSNNGKVLNVAVQEADDENVLKWNLDEILNRDIESAEIIQSYYNEHQEFNQLVRGRLLRLIVKALYDANIEAGPELHKILLRLSQQIIYRFPGEDIDDYYIHGDCKCRLLKYFYKRRLFFGDKEDDKSENKSMETNINDGSLSFNENDSMNVETQSSSLKNVEVNIVELLELNKNTAEAIEKYFYEHGQLDNNHRGMLVGLLIRALYYEVLKSPGRTQIFASLAHQIELRFPGEKQKDYFDSKKNGGRLSHKFYNIKSYMQTTGKELPPP